MDALDVLGTGSWVIAVKVRMSRSVHGALAIDELPEVRRELLVGRVTACPESITTAIDSKPLYLTNVDSRTYPTEGTVSLCKWVIPAGCLSCTRSVCTRRQLSVTTENGVLRHLHANGTPLLGDGNQP